MLNFYKYSLGPVLFWQARRLRATALRLPEASGPRAGSIAGDRPARPLRLLFVGDSTAAGVGVARQEQALAKQASRFLAAKLHHPGEWRVLAQSGVHTGQALSLLRRSPAHPANVLVTALGTNEVTAQRSAKQFLQDYRTLIEEVRQLCGVSAVVVTGLPPLRILPAAPHPLRWYLGRYAATLDKKLRDWVGKQTGFRYVSLDWAAVPEAMARDKFHPGLDQYRDWAHRVADSIAELCAAQFSATHGDS